MLGHWLWGGRSILRAASPEVPGSQPQLTLNLNQVIMQTNVSKIVENPNRQHGRKAYYRQRLKETEKLMFYLLLCRVKSQGHLVLAAKPRGLGDCGDRDLSLGWQHEWAGPGASAHPGTSAPWPVSASPQQVAALASPEILSFLGRPGILIFLSLWYVTTCPSAWLNLEHITDPLKK